MSEQPPKKPVGRPRTYNIKYWEGERYPSQAKNCTGKPRGRPRKTPTPTVAYGATPSPSSHETWEFGGILLDDVREHLEIEDTSSEDEETPPPPSNANPERTLSPPPFFFVDVNALSPPKKQKKIKNKK